MRYRVWDDEICTLEIEVVRNQVFAHAGIKRWSRDCAHHARDVFKAAATMLWLGGAREIFALAPDGKVEKLAKLFGFKRLNVFTDGQVFMKYSIPQPQPT
jgi:hypothetical protein